MTLGGMSVFRGATLLISGGGPISGFSEGFRFWGQGKVLGLPTPVLIFLGFAILAHLVLRYTRFGRQVYAVGGNPEAACLSGLKVPRTLLSVYVIMGFFAGLGGFVLAARLNSAEAVAGIGYELTVIASVVIGGTSPFGGTGTIFGTVIGTVLIVAVVAYAATGRTPFAGDLPAVVAIQIMTKQPDLDGVSERAAVSGLVRQRGDLAGTGELTGPSGVDQGAFVLG